MLSFHTSSEKTRVISETLCPTWDQTILIKSIRIYGDTSKVVESPPPIFIEFMDKDTVVIIYTEGGRQGERAGGGRERE